MKTFRTNSWQQKIIVTAVALTIGAGVLEIVANSMVSPDPGTMAVREQFLAAESERALELRTLQQERQVATFAPANGI